MATTNIELDIENITGVSDANDQFIISAQKFVVSSVPKNLLHFASKQSSTYTGGGGISATSDSVIEVQRNGYSCKEISIAESKWASDSNSLKYATSTHPVWWFDSTVIKILPEPSGSEDGYYYYVDYSELDDDCDLRNAVVFHAASSEFSKLGSAELPTISLKSVPPDVPSISGSSVDFTASAPAYSKPSVSLTSVPSVNDLTISVSPPTTPSVPTISSVNVSSISISDLPSSPSYTTPTQTISGVNWATEYQPTEVDLATPLSAMVSEIGNANSELDAKPVPPDDPDSVPNFSFSVSTSLPSYTSPTVGGENESLTEEMDSDSSGYGTEADFLNFSKWFSVAGEFIEDEEDTELAASQLSKIQTYIQSYSTAMTEELNKFNAGIQKYQAELQKELEEAKYEQQSEIETKIRHYQALVQNFQAETNSSVQTAQGYLGTAQGYANEVQTRLQITQTKISEYQSKVQDALNTFNQENAVYQAGVQKNIRQAELNMQEAQKEADLTLQASIQDYTLELQKFQSDIQNYQAAVNDEVQEYQQNLNKEIQIWQTTRQTELQQYSSDIQNELNEFNKENSIYQAQLQVSIQNAQLTDSKESKILQKYASEVQAYSSEVQTEIQEYQSKIQKQQAYSAESKKYYDWAKMEIANYIQNNSKMIGLTLAAQSRKD